MNKLNTIKVLAIAAMLLGAGVQAADEAGDVQGPLRGHWTFEGGCLPEQSNCISTGNLDSSGNDNNGYFRNPEQDIQGNFRISDLPAEYGSNIALLPFEEPESASRRTRTEPLIVELKQSASIANPLSISLFYRLVDFDEFEFAWLNRCENEAAPSNYRQGFCEGDSENNEMYLLSTYEVDDEGNDNEQTGNGIKLYLNEAGELNLDLQITTNTGDIQSLNLSTPLYDPNMALDADELKAWFNVGISYNPRIVEKPDSGTNLIVDLALLINGAVVARGQQVLSNSVLNPDDGTALFGAVSMGRPIGAPLIGLIDDVRFYNRALTSFELACLAEGGLACVKQEIVGGEALTGFRGISIIDAQLATLDTGTGQVPECKNDDNSNIPSCDAGDLVATIIDPSTKQSTKSVLIDNFQGRTPGKGLAGLSVTNVSLVEGKLQISYTRPTESEVLCSELGGTFNSDTKLCSYTATFEDDIVGEDVYAKLTNYYTIGDINFTEENSELRITLNPENGVTQTQFHTVNFNKIAFDAIPRACIQVEDDVPNNIAKGVTGASHNSARWCLSNRTLYLCTGDSAPSCNSEALNSCQAVVIPRGSVGDGTEGEPYTCDVENDEDKVGDSGRVLASANYSATNEALSIDWQRFNYDRERIQNGTINIPLTIQPGSNGTSYEDEVKVFSDKDGTNRNYSGIETIGDKSYYCFLKSSGSHYLSICKRNR